MVMRKHPGLILPSAALLALVVTACADPSQRTEPTATPASSPATRAAHTPISAFPHAVFFGGQPGAGTGTIASGDLNGDGTVDIVVAASQAAGPDGAAERVGAAYVFFGPVEPGQRRDIAAGDYDVAIYGARAGGEMGRGLAVGDFNGDGIDDLALGAPGRGLDPENQHPGEVYLLPGSPSLAGSRELRLPGDVATIIAGPDAGSLAGLALASTDLNGDGRDDLIIGALASDGEGGSRPDSGAVFVLYGRDRIPESLDLSARGAADVTVYGGRQGDRLGEAVDFGDVNGDGLPDMVLAAPFASGPTGDRPAAGEVYVIISPPTATIDIAAGGQSATILGIDAGDQVGHSIGVGDVNGDGYADLVLGAVSADGPENGLDLAGEAYLVVGSREPAPLTDLARGASAALIYGDREKDRFGRNAAAGDVNGDGLADMVIAASDAGPEDRPRSGFVYVFFEGRPGYPQAAGAADVIIAGIRGGDTFRQQVFGTASLSVADVDDDGRGEILATAPMAGGPDGDRDGAGEAYVVFLSGQ